MSRAVCQNFKNPLCRVNTATYSKQNSLTRDQVVYFETAGNFKCLTSAFILSTLYSKYVMVLLGDFVKQSRPFSLVDQFLYSFELYV